jgi:tetratricopeptide (TPR) repeat protein
VKAAAILQTARELESRGQADEAIASYQKLLTQEPSNLDALTQLGRIQLERGQFEASEKALRRVVTLQPRHSIGLSLLAMVLARTGRGEEAVACFEQAVAADPRSELLLLHYADLLGTLGRSADAVAVFDKALAVNANNIIAWNNRGLALEALGRDNEAAESFRRALALRPDTPQIHFSLGNVLHRMGLHEEAIGHYRRTVMAMPAFGRGHANLGDALFKLDRWEEALASLNRAATMILDAPHAEQAQLHLTIATVLRNLQRDQDSLASYDTALTLDPGNADIMVRKAHALHVLGRMDEARSLAERAISLQPDQSAAYVMLAQTKRFAAGDPAIAKMEALLSDSDHLPEEKRGSLHTALGKAYDDISEFEHAFPHFAAGNEIKRRHHSYDEERELTGIARIIDIFTPELMQSKAAQGHTSARPIFVVGMPRSGTTLLEQIVASHPLVFGSGEQTAFQDAATAAVQPGQPGYPRMVPPMTAPEIKAVGGDYLSRLNRLVPSEQRFTDKMPGNHKFAGLIHLALPNAKIIHVRRNPFDTCLSIFSTNFKEPPRYAYNLGELGRYYAAYQRLMAHWRQILPASAMLDVRYEDVVDDIEGQARRIIAFCGLAWDQACLAFHTKSRAVRTASAYQVRQPLYNRSVGRWRGYEKHLAPLIEALGDAANG